MNPYLMDTENITAVSVQRNVVHHGERLLNEWDSLQLVLVRRGGFAYRDGAGDAFIDPTTCLLIPPLHVAETQLPYAAGAVESRIFVCTPVLAAMGYDDVKLPRTARVTPAMELTHTRLIATGRRGADELGLQELVVTIVAEALACSSPRPPDAGRPATHRARRQLAEDARVLLAGNPTGLSLTELARQLTCSPHHLSRIFHQHTGMTLGRYRTQLRLGLVLQHFSGATDAESLAALAATCGFADHAHLTNTVRRHYGMVPSALRELLREPTD